MLNKSDVLEALSHYLLNEGYSVMEGSGKTDGAVDIIAGDPRSKSKTLISVAGVAHSRAGKGKLQSVYTESQVFRAVTRSIQGALKMHGTDCFNPGDRIALAFPDVPAFRKYLCAEKSVLDSLGIKVFLVTEDKGVIIA